VHGCVAESGLIVTGGTIDSAGVDRLDLAWYIEANKRLGDGELLAQLPELKTIARVEEIPFRRLPSQALVDSDWLQLIEKIHSVFDQDQATGIVITHGTNTLEETAYFLNLVLKTDRPVVLVGSMRPSSAISADGYLNVVNAVRVAADPQSTGARLPRDDERHHLQRPRRHQELDLQSPEATLRGGVAIAGGKFVVIGADETLPDAKQVIDATGLHLLPGLIDAHVHFRDPGVTHQEDFSTGSTAAVCGGIATVIDMPNQIPPTENAEQVDVKRKIAETKSLCDFAILGVVHQTNADDILPMAKRGAIGYKIFFGETIGNLPYPDDGMCQIVFPNITESGVPLCVHAENRQIQHFWTNKLKSEGKNDPIYWESSRPWLCEAESIAPARPRRVRRRCLSVRSMPRS
jgi:hypothetical protein